MQVFVKRSDLTAPGNALIRVLGYHETPIDPNAYGAQAVPLSLSKDVINNTSSGPVLAPGWRDGNREQIIEGEAERRIQATFPEKAQMSAALEVALLAAQHGSGEWPKEAKARRAEAERAWTYVKEVRRAARGLASSPPPDPTTDNHWPTRAAVYQAG